MPDEFAQFLDDISLHIEREIANVPPPVAEALLRGDSGLTTVDVLRILAQPEKAANLLANGSGSAAPFQPAPPGVPHAQALEQTGALAS